MVLQELNSSRSEEHKKASCPLANIPHVLRATPNYAYSTPQEAPFIRLQSSGAKRPVGKRRPTIAKTKPTQGRAGAPVVLTAIRRSFTAADMHPSPHVGPPLPANGRRTEAVEAVPKVAHKAKPGPLPENALGYGTSCKVPPIARHVSLPCHISTPSPL